MAALRFVDTTAEAAGRLVYDATMALGVPLTAEAANALFLALATDTGWFRHSSVEPRTFDLAEELVRAGARPTPLYDAVYAHEHPGPDAADRPGAGADEIRSRRSHRIHGDAPDPTTPRPGPIPPDTEDLINYPRAVAGVEIALVFIEQRDGGTKVSFRGKEAARRRPAGRAVRRRRAQDGRRAPRSPRPLAETRAAVLQGRHCRPRLN